MCIYSRIYVVEMYIYVYTNVSFMLFLFITPAFQDNRELLFRVAAATESKKREKQILLQLLKQFKARESKSSLH
jgi:hypothetical protein